ncbi:MAG: sulfatase-like hydrolase/transferase [Bacteroidetes bacterium]|jgi:arylsulfatase A-like enzyme|nr:sulfatase-like hydrolase/transferase [Bacteroidota bacterium]MBT3751216.1 sulfatase-like hydrolase/transferase [Bacteroidota bacterium]MBT4398268.1 sulfatase-like hydrolase/transferase [Bacteroidota bacterium]MBT4409053.1 sulfatase-like hydrolase/transferase [Bacteroidota bacterium]MBT7463832.1 sulfatase-like hydrolase/transferase [Bacteroidota bacterium]
MSENFPTKSTILVLLTALFLSCNTELNEENPNIILIMGDDIGYSDIGCYGSEIHTPNLDKLAEDGIQFQTFYNMAKCNPTRSTLLTGLYWGNDRVINMASVLKEAGYTTLHSGKEHFDNWVPESCYAKNVFDQSFTFWASTEYFIPPDSTFGRPFFLNGKKLSATELAIEFPDFYKTDVVTDYALRFLDSAIRQEKPFFLYLPYHAAHYPLQAKPGDIRKYEGVYEKGWDQIRQARYEKMIELGVIDEKYALSAPSDNINKFRGHPKGDDLIRAKIPLYRPWDSLTETEKTDLELEMTVFAAIIDCMDQNIGRVIQWLKEQGEFDNTLIMYLTDNGSCPYDSNRDFDHPPGPADSFRTLSAAWANVGNTPFRYFKQFGHEGGSKTQFIVHWPDQIEPGQFTHQVGHLVDIYPTLLEITGAVYPDSINDEPSLPLNGHSLLPVFQGQERAEPPYLISGYMEKFRMFRQGDWKIVKANKGQWQLYDMINDPSEINNLADSLPDKTAEIAEIYHMEKNKLNKDLE